MSDKESDKEQLFFNFSYGNELQAFEDAVKEMKEENKVGGEFHQQLAITQEMRDAAVEYKRKVAGAFMLVEGAKLKARVGGSDFCVTRKIDGLMRFIVYRDGEAAMFSTGGNDDGVHVPCIDDLVKQLKAAKVKSATLVAELYADVDGRPRCHDVLEALAGDTSKLRLAPFDLLELDGEKWKASHYKDTHKKLSSLFKSNMVRPVEMRTAASLDEVQAIYDEWVEGQGAEGLVIHSEMPMVWKVKPRHSIDAAVIGYTMDKNNIRDVLLAVRREDGLYQSFGVVTCASMNEDERVKVEVKVLPDKNKVKSGFIQTDSRGVAFQMVRPCLVLEVSFNELIAESNSGKAKTNPLLEFDAETQSWCSHGLTNGVVALGMSFERIRFDKNDAPHNIRISQLTDICPFAKGKEISLADLPKSTVLQRRVFRKVQKEKVMLRKFLLWKTNKEESGVYPAYVFHYTDYSSGREEPLKRDIRVSNNETQITELYESSITENIKKGWEEVGA